MGTFGESMQELLAKLAGQLGLKASDARRPEVILERLDAEKRRYADRIDDLKEEIQRLERQALKKKQELDGARGDSRRIIVREIESTLRERTMLREKEAILFSRKHKVTTLMRKLELQVPEEAGILPDDMESMADDVALDMQELVDAEQRSDRLVAEVEQIRYDEPERDAIDVTDELRKVEGKSREPAELSDDLLQQLAELEEPEEE